MSGETTITVVGGITADPERRGSGDSPFVTFSVASTPRVFNRETNEWQDGEPTYWDCSASGPLAQSIDGEYRKGSQVIVVGTISTRTWVDGTTQEKRRATGIRVQEIGTKLGRSSSRDGAPRQAQGAYIAPGQGQAAAAATAPDEPWATAVPGGSSLYTHPDDTPF